MIRRRLISLLLCALLLTGCCMSALADEDASLGSLTVHILDSQTHAGVPNAEVSIYLIAALDNFTYKMMPAFSGSGFDVNSIGTMTASDNRVQAALLSTYATLYKIGGTPLTTDASGSVRFSYLMQGLYLVVESRSPADHTPIAPFLITIPQLVDGKYVFDVDAAPKTGPSTPIPTTPTRPSVPTNPTTPPHYLPQTGQLWWPVFLMAGLGMVFFLYGWVRRRKQTND